MRADRHSATWKKALIPLLAVPSIALLAYGFTRDPGEAPSSPLVGQPAPTFTPALFGGGAMTLDSLRGKVVFLNFWASWCPPCRAEARRLEAAWHAYRDRGVVFVGANMQDQEADARAFLRTFGISYPNGIDVRSRAAIDYGVWGLPESFIIDREGRITYKHIGEVGWETLATRLDEALSGAAIPGEGRGEYNRIQ